MNESGLAKIKPLQNPFQSKATCTSATIPSLSRYNDRNRVILTDSEQSCSDQQQNATNQWKAQNSGQGRKSYSRNQTSEYERSEDYQTELVDQTNNRITFGAHRKSQRRTESPNSDNTEYKQNINPKKCKIKSQYSEEEHQQEKKVKIFQEEQQEPADETDINNLIPASQDLKFRSSLMKDRIPTLINASSVGTNRNQNLNGSIIDQIKKANFFDSQVVQQPPKTSTNRPRRTKIFDRKPQTVKKQGYQNFNHRIQQQFGRKRKTNAYADNFQRKQPKVSQWQYRENNVGYYYCPHAQCMLKSLQIIDKLTGPQLKNPSNGQKQQISECNTLSIIQNSSLQLDKQICNFLIELKLDDLFSNQNIKKRIKQYAIQIDRLTSQLQQYQPKTKSSKSESQSIWNIMMLLQNNSKTMAYLQVTENRYMKWKSKLKMLEQKVKGLIKMDKSIQKERMNEIMEIMDEIVSDKISLSVDEKYGFVEAYNNYIERQKSLMEKAVCCLKKDLMGEY